MNVLPNTAYTVGHWPFQGTTKDVSGNGFDLQVLDANTAHTPGGTEQYGTHQSLFGFKFDGNTKMWVPQLAPLLQVAGDITIQFLFYQIFGFDQVYLCLCNPAGRFGGPGDGGRGSVFTYFWGAFGGPEYTNQTMGNNIPSSTYMVWQVGQAGWGVGSVHAYAFRKMLVNGVQLADAFVDGAKLPGTITDTGTSSDGTEKLFVGGYEGTSECCGNLTIMGDLRIDAFGHSDVDIGRDAFYSLGGPVTTDNGLVYDGVATAQFANALHQTPRAPSQ
jgi:hypothetical protein